MPVGLNPSARGAVRNVGSAQRERDRRLGLALDGSLPIGSLAVTGEPGWDAFFGSLHDKDAAAREQGMGFRASLGDIGRFDVRDPGLSGGLNPLERESAKNRAIMREGDRDAAMAQAERLSRDAFLDAKRDAIVDDLKRGEMERGVNEAFADPQASREQVMQRLPAALRPIYAQQWATQDAAMMKSQADLAKATGQPDRDSKQWVVRNGQQLYTSDVQPGDEKLGSQVSMVETAQDRQRKARSEATQGFLDRLNELRSKINTKMGPAAGATGLIRRGAAAIGMDPDVAEYERIRSAAGRALAVDIMGAANLSDADAKAWSDILPGATTDEETAGRLMSQVGRMLDSRTGAGQKDEPAAPPASRVVAPASGGVLMKAPNGDTMEVDPAMVDHYLAKGASRVVRR